MTHDEAVKEVPGGLTDAPHAVAAVEALVNGTPIKEYKFQPPLNDTLELGIAELPAFQQWGVSFIRQHYRDGVLVADDMGLGKTVQTIMALKGDPRPKLVICPAFLRRNWESEIERWAHQACFLYSTKKAGNYNQQPWIIGYYPDAEHMQRLNGYAEYVLVIDEAHNLRGMSSARLQAVQGVANFASGRVLLTGSPLINDGAKLYPLLNLAQPTTFGSFYDFTRRYCGGRQGTYGWEVTKTLTHASELKARLSYFSYRRTRDEVSVQLPFSTKYTVHWLDLTTKYGLDGLAGAVTRMNMVALAAYMRRLAAFKNPIVAEQVISDLNAGVSSLTFTLLREQSEALAELVPGSLCVHGDTPSDKRLHVIAEYVKRCKLMGTTPAVFATMDSLGEGANAQWARVVNFAALDWTPEKIRQCVARSARLGAQGDIVVRFFAARRSADEVLVKALLSKLEESQRVIGSGAESEKQKFGAAFKNEGEVINTLRAMLKKYRAQERE